jgi:PBSX family phage terminase large subunit
MGGHYESITFPNGTKYMFRGLDDWMKLKSLSLAAIFFDEVDELDEETYMGMLSRVRQTRPTAAARAVGAADITRRYIRCASNPAGHNWVWKRFVGPDRQPQTAFFVSTSLDNPHLPMDYIEALLAMPDPWVRRYVLASFDEFAGAIYPEWQHGTHVIDPLKDSAGKYTYDHEGSFFRMGYDPGNGSPDPNNPNRGSLNAALWVYYDKATHRYIGIAEYAEGGLSASAHAKEWRRIEAQHGIRNITRVGDPKAVTRRDWGSNMKLSDQYARLGFHFSLGPGGVQDRVWGLAELIATGRFVVTSECPRTFQQILGYRWEDLTPTQIEKGREAKPLKKDVDLVDAAQYAVSRYVPPPKVQAPPPDRDEQHTREIHANIRKQISRRHARNAQSSSDLGMIV